jgi:ribonuclease HI
VYTLQFDGLYRRIHMISDGYPGIMCYGWLVLRDGRVIAHGHGGYAHWKIATSNGAEYLALIAGLEALIEMKVSEETILIQGDAKTIIEQMQNLALTHSPRIEQFHRQARRLCRNFKDVKWNWTPRRQNHPADQLTREALKQIRFSTPVYFAADVHQMVPLESRKGLQPILTLSTFDLNDRLM